MSTSRKKSGAMLNWIGWFLSGGIILATAVAWMIRVAAPMSDPSVMPLFLLASLSLVIGPLAIGWYISGGIAMGILFSRMKETDTEDSTLGWLADIKDFILGWLVLTFFSWLQFGRDSRVETSEGEMITQSPSSSSCSSLCLSFAALILSPILIPLLISIPFVGLSLGPLLLLPTLLYTHDKRWGLHALYLTIIAILIIHLVISIA